jgi:hypothetical protein
MTGMTGKDMFEFGGELYGDEDDEVEDDWDISRLLARYVSDLLYHGDELSRDCRERMIRDLRGTMTMLRRRGMWTWGH